MWGIIATWCMAYDGINKASEMLKNDDDAGNAIEEAIKVVEDCPYYKSVGYGGLPNEEMEVELDAAFMDGDTLDIGAVGAIKDFANPISIARSLSKEKVNNLLVGLGAEKYASKKGFKRKNMLSDRAKIHYHNRIKEIKEQLKSDDLDEETRAELEKELKDGVDEKLADTDKINAAYLRRAIKKVKPTITDETIDKYKETYGDFAWAVAFAPADDPEIAVAAVVPQGTTSTYAFLPIKDVIGYYMVGSKNSDSNSDNKTDTKNTDKDNNSTDKNNSDSINNDNSSATGSDNKLNFNVQIKK